MKICPVCHTENEDDALYCKKCANPLYEEEQDKNTDKRDKDRKKSKTKKQKKVKNKTKTKTQVKYKDAPKEKQKSSFFSKFLVFILLIIVIALAGVLGMFAYHYYEENNIEVPNVVGYTYEEATAVLQQAKLSYQQETELTTDESEVDVVMKQSRRAGSKTHENAVITLTVGVLDTSVEVPDVRGMALEDAINALNQAGISYQVIYEESDEEENTVLKQSVRPGKEINNTESITLTISTAPIESSSDNNSDSTTPPSTDSEVDDSEVDTSSETE